MKDIFLPQTYVFGGRKVGARGILGVTSVGSQLPAFERLQTLDGRNGLTKVNFWQIG